MVWGSGSFHRVTPQHMNQVETPLLANCLSKRRRAMPYFRLHHRSFILAVFLLVSTNLFVVPFSFRLLSPPTRQADYQQHPASSPNDYGKVPLAFEANAGQVNGSVRFLSHTDGYTLYLTATDPVLI